MYKDKFEKAKGKSEYNSMTVPPDVQHAMDVAKSQSNVSLFRMKRKTIMHFQSSSELTNM